MQKEDVYVVIFFAAVGVAVPAVIILHQFLGINILHFVKPVAARQVLGVLLSLAAVLVCAVNFYLSIINPWLYKKEHGSEEGYDAPSGLPIVSGFFIIGAAMLLPESTILGIFLLALYAIDTQGIAWLFVLTLRHGL